ncbi:MAG: S41 family peptidase [Anaerolineae bacterium]
MTTDGYYRYPTIHKNTVVFVCEDDLWQVSAGGGTARRLTANLGMISHPALSPDGKWLAFVGRDDGEAEVYVMPAVGGPATRLTFLGARITTVLGWTADGRIIFNSSAGQPFRHRTMLFTIAPTGGKAEPLPYGPARAVSFGPDGGVVIGRRTAEQANWKRYRGGTAGDIWIDAKGSGKFKPLLKLHSNLVSPIWLGDRIYFLSDHEGIGNIYSCTPRGTKLERHTHHEDFYVRQPSSDGGRIVYRAGADLYLFDPAKSDGKATRKIRIALHSPKVQRSRRFEKAAAYLEHYQLHPAGHSLALTVRGKPATFSNWEGSVLQYGQPQGVRYRLVTWLNDGERLLTLSDAGGEEAFEIFADAAHAPSNRPAERLDGLDIGRPVFLKVSPKADLVALGNHRFELMLLNLADKSVQVLDKSSFGRISGLDWSADGKWLAYGYRTSLHTSAIKLCHVESGETHFVTPPNTFFDFGPSFDPGGRYLYFISHRDLNPVYDSLYFDLNFPRSSRPYLVSLQAEAPNPFIALPNHADNGKKDKAGHQSNGDEDDDNGDSGKNGEKENGGEAEKPPLQIDLDGIQQRVAAFPVAESRYQQVRGIKGKVLFTSLPVEGSLRKGWYDDDSDVGSATLEMYDLAERKKEYIASGINNFEISRKRGHLLYRSGKNLRVLKAGEKPDNNGGGYTKKSGWIRLSRVKVAISPPEEWQQMFREAWRLQRDHFWAENMSGVDWQTVFNRYYPLIERVAARSEFSDLLWEMQGELGTSHAYELGGDYRPGPKYLQGMLGANLEYNPDGGGYRIAHIVQGDPWAEEFSSPLSRLGAQIQVGDIIVGVDGQPLNESFTVEQALVNRANTEVQLTVMPSTWAEAQKNGNNAEPPRPRTVLVKTVADDTPARYREWVEANRRRVHAETDGRVGYVHIPDMGPFGYAEFHRYYLAESEREGLIVDVRYNGGGHVSQLLIEKLARRRVGYDQPRYGQVAPYPDHSVLGPIVAVTNEYAGSDGDIFSHVFKLLKLGPLVGKRTWGGVIGIWPRHSLVDGTTTTQPEFSFWFEDAGWAVENYGTDPDIEVDIKPQDYAKGKDPQLTRALKEVKKLLQQNPPQLPDFGARPNLSLPKLPKSGK